LDSQIAFPKRADKLISLHIRRQVLQECRIYQRLAWISGGLALKFDGRGQYGPD